MTDLIEKKKIGLTHSSDELAFIVKGFTDGDIPDYQMSAWLMAVLFKGMTDQETTGLTLAMADSGKRLDLSGIAGVKCDKHSTGGVADTTTLVVLPIVAAVGVPVAKMSGRGLGFTGGTVDKLEAIPGFKTSLPVPDFVDQVRRIGLALTGQTPDIAPADGKIYALRDVTGTVNSMPLIASSIMSKKIAAGADKILLDVKCGDGAFMKNQADAVALAELMVKIGGIAGRETKALISRMNEPLGRNVGNSLEVAEAIAVLHGGGDSRLRELCLLLAGHILMMAGQGKSIDSACAVAATMISSGEAARKFAEFIAEQGGDAAVVEQPERLGTARYTKRLRAEESGHVTAMQASAIGIASVLLGAGRERKGDPVDLVAGIELCVRCGDSVTRGDTLAVLHYNDIAPEKIAQAETLVSQACRIGKQPVAVENLVIALVDGAGAHLTPPA
jgi:pyrimidine-nucleoside phosphorylase